MRGCRPLTPGEVEMVLESLAGEYAVRDRCLVLLGTLSGFRVSEMLSLKVRDVYGNGKVLDAVAVARRNMKGKRSGRTVPLNAKVQAAIERQVEALREAEEGLLDPDTYLFRSRKGGNRPITRQQAHSILRAVVAANGLEGKVAMHSLRKTFAAGIYDKAVELQRKGAVVDPLSFVQKAMGHLNINSTMQYLSFREEYVTEAILSL